MKCPYKDCKAEMEWFNHGVCPKCKRYCGCSFSPTSSNDFCREHRPKEWMKKKKDGTPV
jgi:hypothetical protein